MFAAHRVDELFVVFSHLSHLPLLFPSLVQRSALAIELLSSSSTYIPKPSLAAKVIPPARHVIKSNVLEGDSNGAAVTSVNQA